MKEAISGHWILFRNGIICLEDSACEDLYDYNTAHYMFQEFIYNEDNIRFKNYKGNVEFWKSDGYNHYVYSADYKVFSGREEYVEYLNEKYNDYTISETIANFAENSVNDEFYDSDLQ